MLKCAPRSGRNRKTDEQNNQSKGVVMRIKKSIFLLAAVTVCFSESRAATISDGLGLTIDTFPGTGTIAGSSFTDAAGNVVTVGSAFFLSGGIWYGSGNITVTFVSPMTTVGFTFANLCVNCSPAVIPNLTLINSVSLGNGDSYNIPTGIAGGSGAPSSQFFGVSSATGFTTATFVEGQFSSFGISDFRFGATPEPSTMGLITMALLAGVGMLRRSRHRHQ